MRWYVTINGETHGPVEQSVLRSWMRQKQVPPGSMVALEGPNSTWVPIERSSLKPALSPLAKATIGIVACLALLGLLLPEKHTPPRASAAVPAEPQERGARTGQKCVLSIPGSRDRVLLFPTEDGIDEFGKAAASGDEQAMQVAMRSNGGVFVDSGTKCTWLEVGFARTKVRVVEGSRTGLAGYVPTEWASGR